MILFFTIFNMFQVKSSLIKWSLLKFNYLLSNHYFLNDSFCHRLYSFYLKTAPIDKVFMTFQNYILTEQRWLTSPTPATIEMYYFLQSKNIILEKYYYVKLTRNSRVYKYIFQTNVKVNFTYIETLLQISSMRIKVQLMSWLTFDLSFHELCVVLLFVYVNQHYFYLSLRYNFQDI